MDRQISRMTGHIIICGFEAMNEVSKALEGVLGEAESVKAIWKPQNTIEVDEEKATSLMKLIDTLEDDDDVQALLHARRLRLGQPERLRAGVPRAEHAVRGGRHDVRREVRLPLVQPGRLQQRRRLPVEHRPVDVPAHLRDDRDAVAVLQRAHVRVDRGRHHDAPRKFPRP